MENDDLSEYFDDDFRLHIIKDFKLLTTELCCDPRNLLRNSGVYVPKGRNVYMGDALYKVVQEELSFSMNELTNVNN